MQLYFGDLRLENDQLVAKSIKPGQELVCTSSLRGGSLESKYPDGCYDCFCNYGERCGGIFMWRYGLGF